MEISIEGKNLKISLVTSNRESQYTVALLNKLGNKHGFEWVEPGEADLVLCSVCDIDDLPKLKKARKMAGDKPLIMGEWRLLPEVAGLHGLIMSGLVKGLSSLKP